MEQQSTAALGEQQATTTAAETTNAVVKVNVIGDKHGANEGLIVIYNGVLADTPEQKMDFLRKHYAESVKRKVYGISERDGEGNPLKNVLEINGHAVRVKLPAPLRDAHTQEVTENLEEYYNRTRHLAAGAYSTVLKGLERIDFVPQML